MVDPREASKDEVRAALKSMIGLDRVKQRFNDLLNEAELETMRREAGYTVPDRTMHQVFVGPPGTGKTTAARVLAKGYYAAGLVDSPELVERSGRDLVSKYSGGTADKVNELFKESKGKVLFIDEAHNMVTGPQDQEGREALGQFVKLALDNRDDTVIILAGYGEDGESGDVISRLAQYDPGIKRRFPTRIPFDPYTDKQLGDIGESMLKRNQLKIEDSAKKMFRAAAAKAGRVEDSNAGGVENLMGAIFTAQAQRIMTSRQAGQAKPTRDELEKITADDVKVAMERAGL